MNVHLTPPGYAGCSELDDASFAVCEDLESVQDDLSLPTFVWIFVAKDGGLTFAPGTGIGGVQYGIEYDPAIEMAGWTLCTGGAEIPQDDTTGGWPESGTGNAVAWAAACYMAPGEAAKIGYLTALGGSIGVVAVIGDPRIFPFNSLVASGCAVVDTFELCEPAQGFGIVGAGSTPVCGNPCQATPIEEASWSKVKSLF